eukprot:2669131-Rhodomonas_salina.1
MSSEEPDGEGVRTCAGPLDVRDRRLRRGGVLQRPRSLLAPPLPPRRALPPRAPFFWPSPPRRRPPVHPSPPAPLRCGARHQPRGFAFRPLPPVLRGPARLAPSHSRRAPPQLPADGGGWEHGRGPSPAAAAWAGPQSLLGG